MAPGAEPRPEVSVVISTFNRRALVSKTLDALDAQTLAPERFEVVIVDNGSSDGTIDDLEARAVGAVFPLRVIRWDENRKPAQARNAALAAATGAVVAFTDDDCVPAPDWLERGLAHFTAGVATVQGRTLPDPSQPTERWSATQRLESFTGRYETCNVFYRADALRKVGGFDESLGFFGEDIVAGWAVRRLGGGERFAEDAVVHHAVVDAGLGWFLRRTRFYENWSAVVRRFPEMRAEHLWCRYFLRRRSAGFALAVAGIVLGTWRRPLLLLALPYAWYRRPRLGYPESVRGSAEGVVFDAYVFAALVRGSIRHRCVVL